jgi:photosystem II stability/assembly factor-like uncharacterized protein
MKNSTSYLKICLALAVSLCIQKASISQNTSIDWSDLMHNPEYTLQEMIDQHNAAWPERPTSRGQGFKQFERFKWLHESRLHEDGHLFDGDDIQRQWRKINEYNTSRSLSGNWYSLGPIMNDVTNHEMIEGVGRVNSVAFHPTNDSIIFAGAPAGGLWRSFDQGNSWTTNTDDLPTLGISSILFDTTNPDIIYAGTGDRDASDSPGMGVIKSVDGGESWEFMNAGISNLTVGCLRLQPGTGYVFAGTNDGLFRSIDGGMTWEDVGPNTGNIKDFEFHPTNGQIIYATSAGRFYRTIDGGLDWDWVSSVIGANVRMCIAVTPANPDMVYVLKTGTYAFSGFYRSLDAGATFTEMSDTPNIMGWAADGSSTGGQAWYDLCLEADLDHPEIVYVGGIRAKKSIDSGVTWIDVSNNYLHVDMHEMVANPHNRDIYLCNDGGLYQYVDNSQWLDKSEGMVIGQIYQLGQSPHSPNHTLTGYQDNGTMEFDGVYWKRKGGGDGFECAYDFSDPNYRYGSIYYGEVYRTTPEVVNEKICGFEVLDITEEGAWNTPYLLQKQDPTANTMFVGLKNLWRSFNIKHAEKDSIVWQKISENLFNNTTNINELEDCMSNPNIMYLAKDNKKLFRSNNALSENPTWTNLSNQLPGFQVPINSIETHPVDTNIVYICFNNDIYKSIDQGASWELFSPNFPDIRTNSIVMDTTDSGLESLYVGTDMGVYYKDTTMTEFVSFNNGMPFSARVTELEIYYGAIPSLHRIKASTYGRGLWESDLQSAITTNFPAVASVAMSTQTNEVFGSFDVDVIFYKNLSSAEVSGFESIFDDVWAQNANVQNITGGPAQYTVTLAPQSYGEVKLMIPAAAAIDLSGIETYQSDTLRVVYAQAPAQLGSDGPAGVGDANSITFWLRADRNVELADGAIQSWGDIMGTAYSADQNEAARRPLSVSGNEGISGRAAVSFDGENDVLKLTNVIPGRSISAFVMVETDTIKFNDHGWFASSRQPNGYLMHPWRNDYDYHNEVLDLDGNYSGINSFYIGDASAPHIYGFVYHQDDMHQTMTTIFDDTRHPQPGVNIGLRNNTTAISIDIGHDDGYEDSRFGKGRIAEHFVYSERLMSTHQRLVSNYLAALYGIDLGPESRYHHTAQPLEVFGIGKETSYDYHAVAQGLGILKLLNANSLDEGDYLMIGNDEGSLELVNDLYPFQSPRVERTWGFSETGDAGTVTVRLDSEAFSNPEGLGLIITTDNEFMVGSSVTFVPFLIQGPALEAQVDFPENGVFTIGFEPLLSAENLSYASAVVFPNPVVDQLQVSLKNAWSNSWTIQVHNALGQLVASSICSGKTGQISMEHLQRGVYHVSIHVSENVIGREKVIKN